MSVFLVLQTDPGFENALTALAGLYYHFGRCTGFRSPKLAMKNSEPSTLCLRR